MNFLELVKKNRSYRGFDENVKITREEMLKIVDCARLCPSSVNIQPLKYYISCTEEQNDIIQPLTRWARQLQHLDLPFEGHHPTAFVVICHDKNIAENPERFYKDVGIVAQTMLLCATDMGYGGCMIGNFTPDEISKALSLPQNLVPVLIVALGKPDENIIMIPVSESKDIKYYRDKQNNHYVPKRSIDEVVINSTIN
ncbi:MAG: nitroreductase [Clostridiales bacterium]|nr:MAG: nitroreductase [Clostridiales bacterium]